MIKLVPLHTVKRMTYIRCPEAFGDEIILFDHLDGLYSYCLDVNSNVVHLSRFTEVEILAECAV